jgi:hypothetical protein
MDMLYNAVKFMNRLPINSVILGGGEPTEHSQFFDVLDFLFAESQAPVITLATNGLFLNGDNPNEYIDRLLSYGSLFVQITADPRFYKHELNERALKRIQKRGGSFVAVERNIQMLTMRGRALQNPMPKMRVREYPFCFNKRSVAQNGYDFYKSVSFFEGEKMKFCTFSVDMAGDVRISESLLCPPIGNISQSIQEITESVKAFQCENCAEAKSMTADYRKAIGLSSVSQ